MEVWEGGGLGSLEWRQGEPDDHEETLGLGPDGLLGIWECLIRNKAGQKNI